MGAETEEALTPASSPALSDSTARRLPLRRGGEPARGCEADDDEDDDEVEEAV